jgi:hypothetical protein
MSLCCYEVPEEPDVPDEPDDPAAPVVPEEPEEPELPELPELPDVLATTVNDAVEVSPVLWYRPLVPVPIADTISKHPLAYPDPVGVLVPVHIRTFPAESFISTVTSWPPT